MIRAVIDTNVVVSAALNDDSLPAAVLSLALDKNILMFVSAPVLAEYETVLSRPHLKLPLCTRQDSSRRYPQYRSAGSAHPHHRQDQKDESDNRFLECAHAAAGYLVTGNAKHFPKTFERTSIVTPKEFIDLLLPYLAQSRKETP